VCVLTVDWHMAKLKTYECIELGSEQDSDTNTSLI